MSSQNTSFDCPKAFQVQRAVHITYAVATERVQSYGMQILKYIGFKLVITYSTQLYDHI